MVLAQNGWSVSPPLNNMIVPGSDGVKLAPGIRQGDVATVLFYVAARLDLVVEKGVPGWCWGYSYRAVRGAHSISNHAAGCAFDWNAPKHGLGQTGTWSIAQRAILQAIARDCRGVVRFGEFYEGRRDGMHVEVIGTPDKVAELAAMISRGELPGGPDGTRGNDVAPSVPTAAILPPPVVLAQAPKPPPVVEKGVPAPGFPLREGQYFGPRDPLSNRNSVSGYFTHRDDLRLWQERMRYRGWTITPDGRYGDETERVAIAFQRDKSIGCDGLIGATSWGLAWTADITR
jgi:peptidoglycan hydrolase-like protein with peptidoglycan-binding domain